ncbi:MAG: ribbon-helix-helix domain-containing protein [Nitrososphaerota archaeon]
MDVERTLRNLTVPSPYHTKRGVMKSELLVRSGRYLSRSEVVREALAKLVVEELSSSSDREGPSTHLSAFQRPSQWNGSRVRDRGAEAQG